MVQWTHRKGNKQKITSVKQVRPVWPETTKDILQDTREHNNSLQEEVMEGGKFLTTLLDKEAAATAAKEAASKKRGVENVVVEEEEEEKGDKGDVGAKENSWWSSLGTHVSTREDDILYSQQRNRTNALASGAMRQSDELVRVLAENTLKHRTLNSKSVASILEEISEQWGMEKKHVLLLMVDKKPITNEVNERRFLDLWKKELQSQDKQKNEENAELLEDEKYDFRW